MPSDGLWGDGSGYVPHASQDFERWIVDEVPVATRIAVPACDDASPIFIAGLSMGGFAALRLNALTGGLGRLAIVIEHRHLGARQRQRQGHPLANAIATAGHHRGLAMKIKHTRRLK
jgi:hypothetical protein